MTKYTFKKLKWKKQRSDYFSVYKTSVMGVEYLICQDTINEWNFCGHVCVSLNEAKRQAQKYIEGLLKEYLKRCRN